MDPSSQTSRSGKATINPIGWLVSWLFNDWCFLHPQPLISLSESLVIQLKSRMEAWEERSTQLADIFMEMVRSRDCHMIAYHIVWKSCACDLPLCRVVTSSCLWPMQYSRSWEGRQVTESATLEDFWCVFVALYLPVDFRQDIYTGKIQNLAGGRTGIVCVCAQVTCMYVCLFLNTAAAPLTGLSPARASPGTCLTFEPSLHPSPLSVSNYYLPSPSRGCYGTNCFSRSCWRTHQRTILTSRPSMTHWAFWKM